MAFDEKKIADRIAELRTQKGVSARKMSIELGQGSGYINNMENGNNLPSMSMFLDICDYFNITPAEFFDLDAHSPEKLSELFEKIKKLDDEKLSAVISIVNQLS